jgi:dihydroxyacetone kinase-like predicted kinase
MNKKYFLEFILTVKDSPIETIRNSLVEFGEDLGIDVQLEDSACLARNLKIKITTLDPAIIFDICADFGRLKSVKID